jgi:hypothetical protein
MNVDHSMSGLDDVVKTVSALTRSTEKVVGVAQGFGKSGGKVGEMKPSAKICLALGTAALLALFPITLKYNAQTGEGEYKSWLVGVKRTRLPAPSTMGDTHSVRVQVFPTAPQKQRINLTDLPPAQKRPAVKVMPATTLKVAPIVTDKVRPVQLKRIQKENES